jgi:hypothetical protein
MLNRFKLVKNSNLGGISTRRRPLGRDVGSVLDPIWTRGWNIQLVLSIGGTHLDENRPEVGGVNRLDGAFNILQEFWPDINQHVFHGKC